MSISSMCLSFQLTLAPLYLFFVFQGEGHVNDKYSRCSCWTADGSLQDVEASHHGHFRPRCYGLLLW